MFGDTETKQKSVTRMTVLKYYKLPTEKHMGDHETDHVTEQLHILSVLDQRRVSETKTKTSFMQIQLQVKHVLSKVLMYRDHYSIKVQLLAVTNSRKKNIQ